MGIKSGRRTWTDDDLSRAIRSNRTWKAAAHSLGLSQSATPRLQRRARQLGLDTSHFTNRRLWSEHDLKAAIGDSATWSEVIRRLDIADTPESRHRIKGYALRFGVDVARLDSGLAKKPFPCSVRSTRCDISKHLRVAAESIAVAWFQLRGVPVAKPAEPYAYDLLATFTEGIQRIQVKSTTFRQRHGTWTVVIGRRPYVLDKSAAKAPYDPDLIDYFFIIDGDGKLYHIPVAVLAGKTAINIGAYADYYIGDTSSLFGDAPRAS